MGWIGEQEAGNPSRNEQETDEELNAMYRLSLERKPGDPEDTLAGRVYAQLAAWAEDPRRPVDPNLLRDVRQEIAKGQETT